MALDPRKLQKKRERKKAKERKSQASARAHKPTDPFDRCGEGAAQDCYFYSELWSQGIGCVHLSRKLPNGQIALASFLVDVFCLGVKNALWKVVSPLAYEDYLEQVRSQGPLTRMKPECARKLVEESVAYAQSFGLNPHPDYVRASKIFGDINAAACREQFTFGRNGKPYFVQGPYDSPEKCRRIMVALRQHTGLDVADFQIEISADDFGTANSR
jgi:hypothetical protein